MDYFATLYGAAHLNFPFSCRATKSINARIDDETAPPPIKVADVKVARGLASDITQIGAKLYDLLENENTERTERARALRFLDMSASASGKHSHKLK